MMPTDAESENSSSPIVHRADIRRQLGELINHLMADVPRVQDPNFRALLEVSAEVLKGVRTAYGRYDGGAETTLPCSD